MNLKNDTPSEEEVQEFWTNHPQIMPIFGFDHRNATPEEIFEHKEKYVRHGADEWYQDPGQPILSKWIDFESLSGKKVLEIGYGVGLLMNELSKYADDAQGIDLSRSHHELSTHRFRDTPNVHLQVASAENIPFPDDTFDFIVAFGVLHHSAHDQRCYDEVLRTLKPGGRCFLMVYRFGGPKFWWWKIFKKGLLQGGLFKHGLSYEKFITSVTDAYEEDSPGAPVSRHYRRKDINRLFNKFSTVDAVVFGNRNEWDNLPAHRLPLSNWLLSRAIRDRLVRWSGAYWMINLVK